MSERKQISQDRWPDYLSEVTAGNRGRLVSTDVIGRPDVSPERDKERSPMKLSPVSVPSLRQNWKKKVALSAPGSRESITIGSLSIMKKNISVMRPCWTPLKNLVSTAGSSGLEFGSGQSEYQTKPPNNDRLT